MGIFDKLFGGKKSGTDAASSPAPSPASKPAAEPAASTRPQFLRKETQGNSTYEVYKGDSAEAAKAFLLEKRVDKNLYYIVVETPEGNWGLDVKGLYLESLLRWQTDISSARCDGHITKMPDLDSLKIAARGVTDNFVAPVQCGNCNHEWFDGVRYQKLTAVRCPSCKTVNKIDSSRFNVHFV